MSDGNTDFKTTWAVEINYYMDLGFLPENMQYFAISGRAGFYGPKGNQNQPLGLAGGGTATKTEINSEPIRLTFDASKAFMGPKYSHFVTIWVAYRYWRTSSASTTTTLRAFARSRLRAPRVPTAASNDSSIPA